jgi:hypothetical protein
VTKDGAGPVVLETNLLDLRQESLRAAMAKQSTASAHRASCATSPAASAWARRCTDEGRRLGLLFGLNARRAQHSTCCGAGDAQGGGGKIVNIGAFAAQRGARTWRPIASAR